MLRRLYNACLLRPADLEPSHASLEVISVFNPGAAAVGDEVVLLVRVAERPKESRPGFIALPRSDLDAGLTIDWLPVDEITVLDPRLVLMKRTGLLRLTFISHLRVVRSKDGRSIDSVDGAHFAPKEEYEEFGVEDARITPIGDAYYITYVAVSRHGVATAMASTNDFQTFRRHGIIFSPDNRDVLLFPEKIGGEYVALHRPNPGMHFSPPGMWLARSPDLLHWGRPQPFLGAKGAWQSERVGGGTPPIRTDQGWLTIYHGNEKIPGEQGVGVYLAGALLIDQDDPQQILRQSSGAIMAPEADFEREGFVPNVVFPSGLVGRGETLLVYYGAADANTGVIEFSLDELLSALR